MRLAGPAAVLEHLAQFLLLALGGGQRARQVAVLVRLGALRHLRAHLLLDRRRVRRRRVREHAHEVGDLHLGLGWLQQTLPDHLLLLLLASHATLRAQLLLLRLGQLQRLRRRRRRLRPRRRRQRHGVLHVQRDLLAEHLRAVGFPARQKRGVPPLRRARRGERGQKARRALFLVVVFAAQRRRVGIRRLFRLGSLAAEDRARLGGAVLRAQAGHVRLFLERALLDELESGDGRRFRWRFRSQTSSRFRDWKKKPSPFSDSSAARATKDDDDDDDDEKKPSRAFPDPASLACSGCRHRDQLQITRYRTSSAAGRGGPRDAFPNAGGENKKRVARAKGSRPSGRPLSSARASLWQA